MTHSKAQTPVWAFGVCGLPLCSARAPVLRVVRSLGRQRDLETPLRSASPRSSRSAVSKGRSRGHGASRGRRLMGAAGRVGPAGVTLPLAIAHSDARLWGRRSGSSTSPTAEREPRGSSARLRERGAQLVGTPPVEFARRPQLALLTLMVGPACGAGLHAGGPCFARRLAHSVLPPGAPASRVAPRVTSRC